MWIVFAIQVDHRRVWAWCRPSPDGHPGFDDITFTAPDGMTIVDAPEGTLDLTGPPIFTVTNNPGAS